MKTNIVINISPPYLTKFWVLSYGPKFWQSFKLQDSLKMQYLKKEVNDEVCFLHADKYANSLKHLNCPGFWYAVPMSRIESVCPGF